MNDITTEVINFFTANAISIFALSISFLAFLMSFKSYRHSSRANVEIEVENDWNFDHRVTGTYEKEYNIENQGAVGNVFVKNVGGVKTTLETAYVIRKAFRKKKKVTIAPIKETDAFGDAIGVVVHSGVGIDIGWLSLNDAVIEPGDRIRLTKNNDRIFKHLFEKGIFDLSKQDQGQFQLIIKHTFVEEKSNPFRIILSPNSLRFLQLNLNKKAFIEEKKSTTSTT